MTEVINQKLYPDREEYKFPRDREQQLWEALELYPDRQECAYFLFGLHNLYKDEPFMRSMQVAPEVVADLKGPNTVEEDSVTNYDFYDGMLLSMHAALRPIQHRLSVKRLLKTTDDKDDLRKSLMQQLPSWIGNEPQEYIDSIANLGDSVQVAMTIFAERLYPDDVDARADFLAGFCFLTKILDQTTRASHF